ncbi:MAG: hypothetical protein HY918_03330 [Candidatus Doudnabacteria bacterium]|nr:hypothetical protein [Candidatus Doudnabacteria bacterium]
MNEEQISEKLDQLLEVIQNLFILEAVKAKMPVGEIRNILKIDKRRIGKVSKYIKLS